MTAADYTLDQLDPRAYLEQFIADCTCDWCGNAYPATRDEEHKTWVPLVRWDWRVRVEKKAGYVSKHERWCKVCPTCLLSDTYGFAKFIFPIIKNMAVHDTMSQLVAVQPMMLPAGEILYMDYVHRRPEPPRARRAHNDMEDAVLGALANSLADETRPIKRGAWRAFADGLRWGGVRGQRQHAVMLDDANWRLDADPGKPD